MTDERAVSLIVQQASREASSKKAFLGASGEPYRRGAFLRKLFTHATKSLILASPAFVSASRSIKILKDF